MVDKKKSEQVVTAPLVSVKDPSGRNVYLYRGASVEGFDSKDVERLAELGLVGDADENVVPGVAAAPTA